VGYAGDDLLNGSISDGLRVGAFLESLATLLPVPAKRRCDQRRLCGPCSRSTLTALPITAAGRFSPLGPVRISVLCLFNQLSKLLFELRTLNLTAPITLAV